LILTGIGSSGIKPGAIENPEEAFNKTDLIRWVYAISEDLDSKYVLLI
jgi:hypothetical protein